MTLNASYKKLSASSMIQTTIRIIFNVENASMTVRMYNTNCIIIYTTPCIIAQLCHICYWQGKVNKKCIHKRNDTWDMVVRKIVKIFDWNCYNCANLKNVYTYIFFFYFAELVFIFKKSSYPWLKFWKSTWFLQALLI